MDGGFTDSWVELGKLHSEKKDFVKAMYAYQQVNDKRVNITLGWSAYSNKNFDIAIKAFSNDLGEKEQVVKGHYGLGYTYLHPESKDDRKAEFHLNKVIELDSSNEYVEQARELLNRFKLGIY